MAAFDGHSCTASGLRPTIVAPGLPRLSIDGVPTTVRWSGPARVREPAWRHLRRAASGRPALGLISRRRALCRAVVASVRSVVAPGAISPATAGPRSRPSTAHPVHRRLGRVPAERGGCHPEAARGRGLVPRHGRRAVPASARRRPHPGGVKRGGAAPGPRCEVLRQSDTRAASPSARRGRAWAGVPLVRCPTPSADAGGAPLRPARPPRAPASRRGPVTSPPFAGGIGRLAHRYPSGAPVEPRPTAPRPVRRVSPRPLRRPKAWPTRARRGPRPHLPGAPRRARGWPAPRRRAAHSSASVGPAGRPAAWAGASRPPSVRSPVSRSQLGSAAAGRSWPEPPRLPPRSAGRGLPPVPPRQHAVTSPRANGPSLLRGPRRPGAPRPTHRFLAGARMSRCSSACPQQTHPRRWPPLGSAPVTGPPFDAVKRPTGPTCKTTPPGVEPATSVPKSNSPAITPPLHLECSVLPQAQIGAEGAGGSLRRSLQHPPAEGAGGSLQRSLQHPHPNTLQGLT